MLQLLRAVDYLHSNDLMHRGWRFLANYKVIANEDSQHAALTPSSVFLVRSTGEASTPTVKLGRYWYLSRIHDLHKSNRFGPSKFSPPETLPDSWLPREVLQSRYQYTKRRDIWYLAVVVLQMIGGLSTVAEHPEPSSALNSREFILPLPKLCLIQLTFL